jgi:hypothetical protein
MTLEISWESMPAEVEIAKDTLEYPETDENSKPERALSEIEVSKPRESTDSK